MDNPIYDKMIARWHGESPGEIKQHYDMRPVPRSLEETFKHLGDLGKPDLKE